MKRGSARRIGSATTRIENQPYDYVPTVRAPRLQGGSGGFWFQPSSTLAAATGTFPSLTAGSLASQTVYSSATGSLVALSGTYTVLNWWPTSFAASKMTALRPVGNGSFEVLEQAC